MFLFSQTLRQAWSVCQKDLRVWLKQPVQILSTSVPPCIYLLLVWIGTNAVSHNPVALVQQDHGPAAVRISQAIVDADVFRVSMVDEKDAQRLYRDLQVAAIITIPPGFSEQLAGHRHVSIQVLVNNVNLDLTNDIRRAVPDAMMQYYQSFGPAQNPITISFDEHDLHTRDIELFQYAVVPAIVLLVLVNGLIVGGLSTAREWEKRTIKELLLSPATHQAIVLGKGAASFLATFSLSLLVLLVGAVCDWTRPQGISWLSTIVMLALLSLLSSGLGIAVGSWSRRIQPVTLSSTIFSIWLFSLAGGLGVLAFDPLWLQQIGAWIPVSYGIHALQMAVFYSSFDQFGRDVAVVAGSALLAILLGMLAMRRELAH